MFNYLTIVNVDGRPGDLRETQLALSHSASQLPGARCLLLSPTRPRDLLPGIEHIAVAPMGHLEYSLFVTFALHAFIETDYALIVQNDGWVLNGSSFTRDFLEFDYIGAPTSMAEIITPSGRSFVRGYTWVEPEMSHEPGIKINYSMNGGFSLRSRKFLKSPSALGLDYRFRAPQIQQTHEGYKMAWPGGDAWEDVYHNVINRAALDAAGLRFPPLSIGLRFAFEHLNPVLHGNRDISKTFGHHAGMRRLVSLDPLTIRFLWLEHEIRGIMMENEIVDAFQKLGYRVEFAS